MQKSEPICVRAHMLQAALNRESYQAQGRSLICLVIAATSPTFVLFTLNFTITNLPYVPDMGHPGSAKLNMTEAVLQSIVRAPRCLLPTPPHPCPAPSTSPANLPLISPQLGSLFKNTSIGPLYSNCGLTSLR